MMLMPFEISNGIDEGRLNVQNKGVASVTLYFFVTH